MLHYSGEANTAVWKSEHLREDLSSPGDTLPRKDWSWEIVDRLVQLYRQGGSGHPWVAEEAWSHSTDNRQEHCLQKI